MYQTQTLSSFTSMAVSSVPESEGAYQLFDAGRSLIYIGRSDNLRRRLNEHLNSSDTRIRSASYFTYEVTSLSISREQQLLEEYQRSHGRLPRCNDRV